MTDAACLKCFESRRTIRALARAAARQEWLGKPVGDMRAEIKALRERIASCAAVGHTRENSSRGGHAARAK